jgi:hypothetical protein
VENKVTINCANGNVVTKDEKTGQTVCLAPGGKAETYILITSADKKVQIKEESSNRYCKAVGKTGLAMICDVQEAKEADVFIQEDADAGSVLFKCQDGTYLAVDSSSVLKCGSNGGSDSQKFKVTKVN